MRKFPTNYLLHPSSSGYVKVLPTKVPPVGLLTVASALVMAKGSAKVLPSGLTKKTVVEKFLSAAQSERNIRHEWMTVKAWASIINKECPINGHTVGADDVHESIRRDPRYRAQDMDGALNGVGVYRHRMTADTGKKVWCCQCCGFDAAGNAFGSCVSSNPFLGWSRLGAREQVFRNIIEVQNEHGTYALQLLAPRTTHSRFLAQSHEDTLG